MRVDILTKIYKSAITLSSFALYLADNLHFKSKNIQCREGELKRHPAFIDIKNYLNTGVKKVTSIEDQFVLCQERKEKNHVLLHKTAIIKQKIRKNKHKFSFRQWNEGVHVRVAQRDQNPNKYFHPLENESVVLRKRRRQQESMSA